MRTIYLVSEFDLERAVIYKGKMHHMSIRAACRRFAPDAIALAAAPDHYEARDILKLVSSGTTHMSSSVRQMIAVAEVQS